MHRNGRSIKLSSLRPNAFSLPPRESGVRPTVVCPDCDTHRVLARTLIHPHRVLAEVSPGTFTEMRCPGSGTTIVFDVTAEDWEQSLRHATHATESRRAKRLMLKPESPVAVPVFKLARA